MTRRLIFDFSGLGVELTTQDTPGLFERLGELWNDFRVDSVPDPCVVQLAVSDFDRPFEGKPFHPKGMRSRLGVADASFSMPEGRAEVNRVGEAQVQLNVRAEERFYTLVNMVRATFAWRLPQFDGLMLHAAGARVGGKGWVLIGPENSGKTTWVTQAELGGAHAISDDVILLHRTAGSWRVLGSPFHSTYKSAYPPGSWPLQGLLLPEHGAPPVLEPRRGILVRARLAANLPFVSDQLGAREELDHVFDSLVAESWFGLRFAPDPSFVSLLEAQSSERR